jgi:DNA-binding NarL/FixJ family response regulator
MKVVLVDNQTPFRESLKFLIGTQRDMNLVGVGADGFDAIRLAEMFKPDVVVIAIDLPLLDGMKVTSSIRVRCPETSVMIVAEEMNNDTIIQAVRRGVKGFLLRHDVLEHAIKAIRILSEGSYFMSREIAAKTFCLFASFVMENQCKTATVSSAACERVDYDREPVPLYISKVELQIVSFVGRGFTNREIAETLDLQEGTVRNYISIILRKTNLENRTQIALYAINNGFATKTDALKRNAADESETKKTKKKEDRKESGQRLLNF